MLNWRHGSASSPLPPAHVATGGPAGADDGFLLIRTDGGESGSGSRLVAINSAQWAGDYLTAGIGAIEFDAKNFNAVALSLRLAFGGTGDATFVTDAIELAAGTDWTTIRFSLGPSEMAYARGAYAECFGGVTNVRILHNPLPPTGNNGDVVRDALGVVIPAQLGVDNITAVPEPASIVSLTLSLLLTRRRRAN